RNGPQPALQVNQRIAGETRVSPRPRRRPRSAFHADNVGSNPAGTSLSPPAVDYAQQINRSPDSARAGLQARSASTRSRAAPPPPTERRVVPNSLNPPTGGRLHPPTRPARRGP